MERHYQAWKERRIGEPALGQCVLNLRDRTVRNNETGQVQALTNSEFQILWLIMRSGEYFVSSTEINDFLFEHYPDEKDLPLHDSLSVFIHRIRTKLALLFNTSVYINHEQSRGYQLRLRD